MQTNRFERRLYSVDWMVWLWLAWREMRKKPLPRRPADKLFYVMEDEQLDNFLKFRDSVKFLNCEDCYVYIQPKGLL